jgi:DNA adenine methylase
LEHYVSRWPFDKESYYDLRAGFNETHDPLDFFCLLRTCRNGLVRYNQKGAFTSGFHQRRRGIHPKRLVPIMDDWHKKLNDHDILFQNLDYSEVQTSEDDFLYLDPPYVSEDEFYQGRLPLKSFWKWLNSQQARWALSFNAEVPKDLYVKRETIQGGFQRVNRLDKVVAQHDLYLGAE